MMAPHAMLLQSDPIVLRERTLPHVLPAEKTVSSQALLKGSREVLIQHGDRVYRLRHTSNDKLILTK